MRKNVPILIVDDDPSQIRTMSLILGRKGYDVVTARDGLEAVEKSRNKAFDIIIMDIKMPVLNGVDAYKEIKKIQPDSVVMMMTAYAVEDLIQEALREGAYRVLHKPLDMGAVTELIDKALRGKKGASILVVDDDDSIRTTLYTILTEKGYDVFTVHTGEEAISNVKKKKFKVVLIDMKLPTIDGLETFRAVKQVNPDATAIMITAYLQEMEGKLEEAVKSNAYTCMSKPLDIDTLVGLIDTVARKKARGQ